MRLQGAGAPGTIDATVHVSFRDGGEGGQTTVEYDADAVVGGMVGGVGQRMLGSVSKRMAGEFFANVARAIGGEGAAPVAAPAPANRPSVRCSPRPPVRRTSQQEFLKGIAVGAGLVLLGVVAGSLFGRRRR